MPNIAIRVPEPAKRLQSQIARSEKQSRQRKIWHSRSNFSYRPICMPLEGADQLHLRAAHGYIELELFEEANVELEEIDPFCRHSPEVLMARLAIYHGLNKWELLAVVAKKLVEWNPTEPGFFVELAYAVRRAESIHEAHAILTRAAGLHPNDPTGSLCPGWRTPN
jgi:hypothetical protein